MEVHYERQMRHNYLIIKPEDSCEKSYESRMLMGNAIDGLLKFRLQQTENGIFYYYEITSKQPLSRILEGRWIGRNEITGLIASIARILEKMENYLLPENRILLEPEYIYVNPENFKIFLCLIPGRKADLSKSMERLLQYILKKVDHNEKDGVLLAYRLYQESQKEFYGMDGLLKWLPQETKAAAVPEDENSAFASPIIKFESSVQESKDSLLPEYEKEDQPKRKKKAGFQKSLLAITGILMMPGLVWMIKGTGFFMEYPFLLAAWYGIWGIFSTALWIIRRVFSDNVEEKQEEIKIPLFKPKEERSWEVPFLPEESSLEKSEVFCATPPAAPPAMETQLLTPENTDQRVVRYLISLDKQQEDIPIAYFPFIIGKKSEIADYILNKDTVSRLHVKLEEKDGRYQITDLNSTNGTMVKGVMLQNNETKFLEIGDEVYIADSGFRFM